MPVMDGFQVLAAIKEQGIQVKTIVVSADLQIEARNKVAADGAIDFIRKPVSASALLDVLNTHGLL
ncbi:response regulator [Psychromonas sp. KJ10-2]